MKLSVVFLFGIVIALSGMSEADVKQCAEDIDAAQACARACGYEDATINGYFNLLQECALEDPASFSGCCFESGSTCATTWATAKACLDDELAGVKTAAEAYFDCSLDVTNCPNAAFCVNFIAGGYGTGAQNDFAVGDSDTNTSIAVLTREASDCEDEGLNKFGYNFCAVLGNCCDFCKPEIGDLANAILDELLLPAHGTNNLAGCSKNSQGNDKTCDADYLLSQSSTRFLETDLAGPKTLSPENAAFAAELALECNEGLNNDMIVHNETYAINNYLDCVYKKTGKAAAQLEDSKQAESSSISLSFGPIAALSAVASSLYAIVVA